MKWACVETKDEGGGLRSRYNPQRHLSDLGLHFLRFLPPSRIVRTHSTQEPKAVVLNQWVATPCFTGVASDHQKAQMLTIGFITVAKLVRKIILRLGVSTT